MAGGYWGSRYNSGRYWTANYFGLTGDLPAGSIAGQAAGIAAVTGDLSALASLSGSALGLAAVIGELTTGGLLSGVADGVSSATGDLTAVGGPIVVPTPGTGGRAAGPARRRRKKKRKLTVEELLELARARGTLRRLDHIWSVPEPNLLPRWEDMKNEWEVEEEAPKVTKRSPSSGPAFMMPEADSFEKNVSDASRVVIDNLLAEARKRAALSAEQQRALLRQAEEDDEEDLLEMLLLDLL